MYMRRNADFSATGSVIVSVLGEQGGSLIGIVSYFITNAEIYVERRYVGSDIRGHLEGGRLKPTLP
jgi:hypothetical protein